MNRKLLALAITSITSASAFLSAVAAEDPHTNVTAPASVLGAAVTVKGADVIVPGNEFAVASGFIGPVVPDPWPAQGGGTHFHSADGLPSPAASENDLELGNFPTGSSTEEVRGMVEFDLAGLSSDIAAVAAQCDVAILGGLYGQGPNVFDVTFSYYAGNNREDLSDFGAPLVLPVPNELMTLSTGGLAVGDSVSIDVTAPYLDSIANADPALGVLAQAVTDPVLGAITINNCFLQITEENIDIDIKPGSFPNSINTKSRGVIPVAILGSPDFDVTTVNVVTLEFGPAGASPAHEAGGHLEDMNYDGVIDLVSHYHTQETGLAIGDEEACVVGATTDGVRIRGCDSVQIVK